MLTQKSPKHKPGLLSSLLIIAFLFYGSGISISAQKITITPDSLSLKDVIAQVISSHPSVKGAEEALKNAEAKINLARTGYYPVVDAGASYSLLGPVTTITIPNMGSFQLFPQNNYSAAVNVREAVCDFGRTKTNVEIENGNKALNEITVDQVRQKMTIATINSFYTLAFLQQAIKIMDDQLATLNAHLKYVEQLKSTGSATDYQVLSTRVKISAAESQKTDLQSALAIQQTYLRSLTGSQDRYPVVKEELDIPGAAAQGDSLLSFAYRNRDEFAINRERESIARLRYQLTKNADKPYINFIASGGAKNGYLPVLGRLKANYVIGLNISVPIFDGGKTKYNLQQVQSSITSIGFENEGTRRSITTEVKEAQENVSSAKQKVHQNALQLEQAQTAYTLAETSFRSGVITNLELLDASTTVSQSMLMLLKSRIDYAASVYRLKSSIGEKLY
jgi:outer membrane protein